MTWNCDACGCCCCEYGDLNVGLQEGYYPATITGNVFAIHAAYEDSSSCEVKCVVNLASELYGGDLLYKSCNDNASPNWYNYLTVGSYCTPCYLDSEDPPGCWDDVLLAIPCSYGDAGCEPAYMEADTDCCDGFNNQAQGALVWAGFRVTGGDIVAQMKVTGTMEKHDAGYDCASASVYKCTTSYNGDIDIICTDPDYDDLACGICSKDYQPICGCAMETVSNCITIRGNCATGTLTKGTYVLYAVFDSIDGHWHSGMSHDVELTKVSGDGILEACPSFPALRVQGLKAAFDKKELIKRAVKKAKHEAFFHSNLLTKLEGGKPRIHPYDEDIQKLVDALEKPKPTKKQIAKKALREKYSAMAQAKAAKSGCGCGGKAAKQIVTQPKVVAQTEKPRIKLL